MGQPPPPAPKQPNDDWAGVEYRVNYRKEKQMGHALCGGKSCLEP